MGIPFKTQEFYDNGAGIDLNSSATKVAENAASLCLNVDYSTDGAFKTRYGSTIQNVTAGIPAQMSGAPTTLALYDYHNSAGVETTIIVTSDGKIKHDIVTPTNVVTGLTTDLYPDLEFIVTTGGEYLVFGNGVDTNLKYDGTNWTNLSLPVPTAPTLVDFAAGTLAAGTYYYYVTFAVTSGGVIVQESEVSPISSGLTIAINREIQVTIPVCAETLAAGVTAQCNARVLYRISPTSVGLAYRIATIADNITTTYLDNVSTDGSIEPDFDNVAAPKSAIFEVDDYGRLWLSDYTDKSSVYTSSVAQPWNVPVDSYTFLDGPIQCMKRCFGTIVFGTDRSLWVQNGVFGTAVPRKFSSKIGILNNRCAAGEDSLYIVSTTNRLYSIAPTDFSQDELRVSDPLSTNVNALFSQIGAAYIDNVCLEYYSLANIAKIMVCVPLTATTNNRILVFNELQSQQKKKPVWQVYDNIFAGAIRQMTLQNESALYIGDYNGLLWKIEDSSIYGDGAEENGTATSSTATTLADTSQAWTVNQFVGCVARIIDGYGVDQYRTVVSNTATVLTVDSAWDNNPNTTSAYTVGGYDAYQYSNWKKVLKSYDNLKQLWYILANANSSGTYSIDLIVQADFNNSETDQSSITFTLETGLATWGSFIWGEAIWGSSSVFQSMHRLFLRFRAIRLGFMNREAGQPFQINGFTIASQDKGIFFGSAS